MANMGSVYQREDGKWCAALWLNGRRKVVYGKNEREAKRKLAEIQGQVAITGSLPNPGNRTVDDLLTQWLETAGPNLKASTLADYCTVCNNHIRPSAGRIRLARLEPIHIQNLLNLYLRQGKNRMAQLVHTLLHRALYMAVIWGWLATNPCDRVIRPSYQAKRKDVWSQEQLAIFLEGTSDSWLHPLWVVAVASGARIGELLALRWDDIDLGSGEISIQRTLHRINGEWAETTPKTQSGERRITVPSEAVSALRRQKTRQAEHRLRLGPDWKEHGLVFTGEDGVPVWFSTVEHAIKKACVRLGLPAVTPHGLRHLHASLLLSKGLPITAVSSRLGHANSAITMQIYAHALKKQDTEAADIMAALLQNVV